MKKLNLLSYILVVIIFLVTTIHYLHVTGSGIFTTGSFFENSESLAGVEKTFLGTYKGSFKDGFLLEYNKRMIPFYYDKEVKPSRYGNTIVYGIIQKDGRIKAIDVHNYNYNYVIYFTSLITGILVLVLFLKEWKITTGGLKSA